MYRNALMVVDVLRSFICGLGMFANHEVGRIVMTLRFYSMACEFSGSSTSTEARLLVHGRGVPRGGHHE